MRRSVPPATVETSTARVRLPEDSILLRPIFPILRRSQCSRKVISSGGSRRAASAFPIEGMPWKSAMPRWELELPDEWIWKIIMGEYDGAHQSPRTWE